MRPLNEMADEGPGATVAIVFAGGPAPPTEVVHRLPDTGLIIAADSGLDHAKALGLQPMLVIGDMDSVSADGLHWAQEIGAKIVEHPADKDATDLDLALSAAVDMADEVVVVDSGSGRLDHVMANLALLGSARFASARLTAYVGGAAVTVVRSSRILEGQPGDEVSLLAVGGPVEGLTVEGVVWPLADHRLEPGTTLGVSNVFDGRRVVVSVAAGVVLAIQPGEGTEDPPIDGEVLERQ